MDNDKLPFTPLHIICGTTYTREIEFTDEETGEPIDVSEITWKSQIRLYQSENSTLIASFTIEPGNATNKILISIDDGVTLTVPPGEYYYDLRGTIAEPEVYMRGPAIFEGRSTV